MERKLASIQRIIALNPIKDADKIEVATVLGWQVVVLKNQFKVGDLCVYVEIDSILPDKREFEFMRERKFRVKTIKLKGQVSQGICFSLLILPKGNYKEDDDVTNLIGVLKYDPQAEFERKETERLVNVHKNRMSKFLARYAWYRKLMFKPTRVPFPSFIKKTDEERIQNIPNYYENWKDFEFDVTEKIDGQSATYFVIPNPKRGLFQSKWLFGVCSRNFQLLKPDKSSYWTIANQYDLKKKMIAYCKQWKTGLVIQGEILGNKIQANKYKINGYDFYLFNAGHYYNGKLDSFNQSYQKSIAWILGIKTVPSLYTRIYLLPTINCMIEIAKGSSTITDVPREGIVVRNYQKNISFKVINPDFLLKYQE